jgi:hypothetical protein
MNKQDFTGWEWWAALNFNVRVNSRTNNRFMPNPTSPLIMSASLPATNYDNFVVHEEAEC